MTEEFEVKERTKITALKWSELTQAEQTLVINKAIPTLEGDNKAAFIALISLPPYYFDRLGNIYIHYA